MGWFGRGGGEGEKQRKKEMQREVEKGTPLSLSLKGKYIKKRTRNETVRSRR